MIFPRVSVIINCFNGEDFLREAMNSVFKQTYDNWELIVWDNGSVDATPDIVKSFGSRARYFRTETTCVVHKARNLALAEAKGEFIAYIDHDDIWHPSYLEKMVFLLEGDDDLGLVFTNPQRIDEEGRIWGKFSDDMKMYRGFVFHQMLDESFVPHPSAVVFRKSMLLAEGGFNEVLCFSGDFEIYLKMTKKHKVDFIEEPLTQCRHHGGNTTKIESRCFEEIRGTLKRIVIDCPDIDPHYKSRVARRMFISYASEAIFQVRNGKPLVAFASILKGLSEIKYNVVLLMSIIYRSFLKRRVRRHFMGWMMRLGFG